MLATRPISTLPNKALPSTEFKKSSANHRVSFPPYRAGVVPKVSRNAAMNPLLVR